jgi:hypothetical protein
VAIGAWGFGHGVVGVGFGGGIEFEISRKGQCRQLKDEGDLKQQGDNVPEELECVELERADSKIRGKSGSVRREGELKDMRKERTASNQHTHTGRSREMERRSLGLTAP